MVPQINQELEALREIAAATAEALDPEEILAIVRARWRALLDADWSIVLREVDSGELVVWGDERLPPETHDLAREALDEGIPRTLRAPGGASEALAIPFRYREERFGALVVGWERAEVLPPVLLGMAETVGVHTAVALHNVRLHEDQLRSARARDRFFSAMSHDLRTPIAAIVGYSELLADGIVGSLNEKQQEMVERISQVAGHLTELVNDVLDLAKLDAGRIELELSSVSLRELVETALLEVQPQADAKSLPLHQELGESGDSLLRIDPLRVRQILVNLLSNAVKFTETGEIRLLAGLRGSRGWITVRDTGPGLPEGTEEAVFEEFLQMASGSGKKQEPGSGLGLAVSRRLARAMGGDLTVESRPGEGAAFTLILPLQRAPAAEA